MKEEAALQRRLSLCPPAAPPKPAPRRLARTPLLGDGENEPDPLSPGCLPPTAAPGAARLPLRGSPTGSPPGTDGEHNGPSLTREERPPTPGSAWKLPPAECRLCNGSDRECVSPTAKAARKETLKVQKENYRQEKKRATKQLLSALTDPRVVIMADSLKVRGTLKGWTKLWCVLKPGALLIYKTPGVGQWVGTVLLQCCRLLERPSKKDGFCFKLFHPLDQSVWAVKGPRGESVGSITQPLPSSYLIFRAASESDGRCWLDALELALRCSSLLRLSRPGSDQEPGSSPDGSPSSLCGLPPSAATHHPDLLPLNGSALENDAFSDRSEREAGEDSEPEAPDLSQRSRSDLSQAPGAPGPRGTTYVEQPHEELGEPGAAAQEQPEPEEHRGLVWLLLRQLRPGMDLAHVALPTFVLEPRSFLCKLSDHCAHADLLSRAALEEDAYGRFKQVLRWYLSGFYQKPKGIKKPYNPVLGETFRCSWFHPQTHSLTFYIAEQVSHHPPVSAFHVSNRKDGFCVSGSVTAKSRFYGNSLSALLDGQATLTFLGRAEDYTLTMPYAHCRGLLYGTMTMELGGRVTIECKKSNFQAELEFKLKPFFGGSTSINQVSGRIVAGDEELAQLWGRWDGEVFIREEPRGGPQLFWSPSPEVRAQRLRLRTVLPAEQAELESERLWQGVTSAIRAGDQQAATREKLALEEAQRQRAREQQQRPGPWAPRLFRLDPAAQQWCYRFADLRPWDPRKDVAQYEQDGALCTLQRDSRPPQARRGGSPEPRHQRPGPDRRLRKASDQPSGRSRATESSSTPESCPELSDEDGHVAPESPCPRCRKEAGRLQALQEAVLSIRDAQQELHRHLVAMLSASARARRAAAPGLLQSPRAWGLLCVLLACQLLLGHVLT
uniref:Oxysterol-binding protein n=1 Tax=Pipistrellus kuhlii TaxID=59472 RepID=A0A7J7R7Y4_PIPKU|nr:oxysterol binding protein like 5 [Pipistrellus kuhlii]